MIELALLAQLYQKPDIDFQAAVQRALNKSSKNSSVSLDPLEQRIEPTRDPLTLNLVVDLLARPYMSPKVDDPRLTYSELVSRGNVIKYALEKFPLEELRGTGEAFFVYFLRCFNFQFYIMNEKLNALLEDLKDRGSGLHRSDQSSQKERKHYDAYALKRDKRLDLVDQMASNISNLNKEVIDLMKKKGYNSFGF